MKNKPLKTVSYISIRGAEPVLLDSLTDEQWAEVREIWQKRLTEMSSRYFAQHPEQLKPFYDSETDASGET